MITNKIAHASECDIAFGSYNIVISFVYFCLLFACYIVLVSTIFVQGEMNDWIKHIQISIALESGQEADDTATGQAMEYPVFHKKGKSSKK